METAADVSKKVEKIINLIKSKDKSKKDGNRRDAKKESELVRLIEDFHKQHQSLFALYDNLKRESEKLARDMKEKEGFSSPTSSSDSEYFSSDETEANRSRLKSEQIEATNNILKEELEAANAEVAELKHQLASRMEEKEALVLDYMAALSKIQESETINKPLRNEVDEREIYEVPGDQESGQISDLEDQLTNLKTELEILCCQKSDMEAQLVFKAAEAKMLSEKNKSMEAQIFELKLIANKEVENADLLKEQVSSLHDKQAELEAQLEKRTKKMSLCLIQLKTMKEELSRKNAAELKILEEREGLLVQMTGLKSEVETLHKQKTDVEKQLRSKTRDTGRLRGEKKGLLSRRKSDGSFSEKGSEPFVQKNAQAGDDSSVRIVTLKAQVEYLQQELNTLKNRNNQLELHLTGEKEQNMILTTKIADQQRIINDQEKAIDKFIEDSKLMKRWSWSTGTSKINQHAVERKMEDLEDKFRKKLEDSIRLLYQRIRVAEKTHYENTENLQKMKDRYEQENESLKEKVATYEAETKKLRGMLEPGINALVGLDLASRKLEHNGNFLTRISNARNDLVFAKNWASRRNNEIRLLRSEMNSAVAQLDDKLEQEFLLREKVWNLEEKLNKEVEEKLSLIEAVRQLEKRIEEKDDRLSGLGEEKREAIRQLCLLIDYHHGRYHSLKGVVSNSKVRNR